MAMVMTRKKPGFDTLTPPIFKLLLKTADKKILSLTKVYKQKKPLLRKQQRLFELL